MTASTHEPGARRDHLWVVGIIAACALLEVWASWLGIGSVSGFPKLGRMTTGWILPVTTEAYWGYALYAWLAAASGPRSRRFAMWTAIVMFILSMLGQEAGHLVSAAHRSAPWYVQALATALPLIAVGLIAVLVHLRQLDREEARTIAQEAAAAERLAAIERAEADDRAALRAQVDELTAALENAAEDLATARREAAAAVAKAEVLTRKLAGNGTKKRRPATGSRGGRRGAGSGALQTASATGPGDPETTGGETDPETLVAKYLGEGLSASEAGRKAGLSDSRGRQIARKLAEAAAADGGVVNLDDRRQA